MTSLELEKAEEVDLGELTSVDMSGMHHLGYLARLHGENEPQSGIHEDTYLLRGVDRTPKLVLHVTHGERLNKVEVEPVDDQPIRSLPTVGALRTALHVSRLKRARLNLAEASLPQNILDVDDAVKHDKNNPDIVIIQAAA